jgi:hypothetical protein
MMRVQTRGIALLESAGWLVVISGLLYAIALLNRDLTQTATIERIVNGISVDTQERLWTLTSEGDLTFRVAGIDEARNTLHQKLTTESREHYPSRKIGGLVCSYESEIDPISGNLVATVSRICQGFGVRDSLAHQLDIKFSRLSELRPFPGAKTVPGGKGGEFFPRSAVFGIAISLEPVGHDESGNDRVTAGRLIVPTNGVQLR